MPVRQDKVQIRIDFITDESKAYANIIKDTEKLQRELKTAQKNGGDLNAIIQKIVDSGQSLKNVDLSKLMPSQLITRANQLKEALKFIPAGHPDRVQMETEMKRINTQLSEMNARTRGVSNSFKTMKDVALGAFIGGGLIGALQSAVGLMKQLFSSSVAASNQMETAKVSFETMLDSSIEAEKLIKQIQKLAAATPFETDELTEYVKRLLAMDVATDKVIPTMTALGNIAAGVGKEKLPQLVLAFGQVQSKLKLTGGELKQFNEAGVGIAEALSKTMGVAKESIDDMASQSKISFKDVEKAIFDMSAAGGKFENLMQKQSKTLSGLWSTLKDNFTQNVLVPIGDVLSVFLKPILEQLILEFNFLALRIKAFYAESSASFQGFKAVVSAVVGNVTLSLQELVLTANIVAIEIKNALTFDASINKINDALLNALRKRKAEIKTEYRDITAAGTAAYILEFERIKKANELAKSGIVKKNVGIAGLVDPEAADKAEKDRLKRVKDALDIELKDKEIFFRRESLVNELAFLQKQKTESDYNKLQLELERDKYNNILKVYDTYQTAFSAKSEEFRDIEIKKLEAQKKLLEVNAQLAQRNTQVTDALPGIGTPAGVNESATGAGLGRLRGSEDVEMRLLQAKFARMVNAEQKFELEKLAIRRRYAQEALDFALANGEQEKGQIARLNQEKVDADAAYQRQLQENEKRTAQLKREMEQLKYNLASQSLGAAIELLSKDEAARKKNAAAIKAFQIGQITIDGIAEVTSIWRNSATYGPILGPIIGTVQTAIAVARSIAAINKVRSQKFAKGGIFGGMPHSQGGTKGVFDDGTSVEVEKGEAFVIVNKKNTPMLSQLSAINSYNGNGVPFATGGALYNTTPTFVKFNSVEERIDTMLNKMDKWQTNFEVSLPITSLEKRQKEVQLDRQGAEI